jgi:hypothetical protein
MEKGIGVALSTSGRDEKCIQDFGCETGRDQLEDLSVDILLEWILGIQYENVWVGCIWLRIGPNRGLFEHGNEPSSYIRGGEFD